VATGNHLLTASQGPAASAATGGLRIAPAPKRILVKAVNWLGDLVMSLPALRAVRHAFPDAFLAVLVKQELAGFFDGISETDEVMPYSVRHGLGGLNDRRRIVGAIGAGCFDLGVLMPNSLESALWVAAGGVARRAGFIAQWRGPILTHRARPPRDALDGHQAGYWLAMVRETLGVSGDATDFALSPHPAHVERMRKWLQLARRRPREPFVAIAPAAAYGPAKQWPAEKFAALIDLLADRNGIEAVLVGAPGERSKCEEVARQSRAGATIAAGETGVNGLIALLSLARGFVGNDSGSMHVASALGTPTVAIFGSTSPLRTGPLGPSVRVIWRRLECSPCLARQCRLGHYNCLRQVESAEALEALRELGVLD
jgi:lipopolysaccharide heptosyltransferase II